MLLDANFPTLDPDGDPEFNAEDLLTLLVRTNQRSPDVILITGAKASAQHFEAIRDWLRTDRITDVVPKTFAWDFLKLLLRHKVELLRRNRFSAEPDDLADQEWLRRNSIISQEPEMMQIVRLLRNIVYNTRNDRTVLIKGPTGSGKGLIARAIHNETQLRTGHRVPFVVCRSGTLSKELLTELFGCVRGAYTGATTDRKGLLEEAGDGVLFVDNVHLLPTSIQGALLDAFCERQFRRVGDNHDRAIAARIIVATNASFGDLLDQRSITEEFYNRINCLEVKVPSLAQRPRDIEPLMRHFGRRADATEALDFGDDVVEAFRRYRWPGNVRQLENLVSRIRVLVDERKVTMTALTNLKLDYLGHEIEWGAPVELPQEPQNERDYLLMPYGWSEGWIALADGHLESVKGWLKQCLGPSKSAAIDEVHRRLEGRTCPRAIHYFKAWLFIALIEGQTATQKQLMSILDLEWDFTNRIVCFLAGVPRKGMQQPLERPVIQRNEERGRWIYRLA